jgi:hypothetical protein
MEMLIPTNEAFNNKFTTSLIPPTYLGVEVSSTWLQNEMNGKIDKCMACHVLCNLGV